MLATRGVLRKLAAASLIGVLIFGVRFHTPHHQPKSSFDTRAFDDFQRATDSHDGKTRLPSDEDKVGVLQSVPRSDNKVSEVGIHHTPANCRLEWCQRASCVCSRYCCDLLCGWSLTHYYLPSIPTPHW